MIVNWIGLGKILADDLANDEVSSLVEFMASASSGKLARRGKRIEITGMTNKKVKFLLHKLSTKTAAPLAHCQPEN